MLTRYTEDLSDYKGDKTLHLKNATEENQEFAISRILQEENT